MASCKDTCDDQGVARPATGKTPVRNLRSRDETWLPALAKTVARGSTLTEKINADLDKFGRDAPELTFALYPASRRWLETNYPQWQDVAAAVEKAAGLHGGEF